MPTDGWRTNFRMGKNKIFRVMNLFSCGLEKK